MFLNLSQDKRMACGAALIDLTSTTGQAALYLGALAPVPPATVMGAVVFAALGVLDALEVYDKCVVDFREPTNLGVARRRPAPSLVRARAMMCLAPSEGAASLKS